MFCKLMRVFGLFLIALLGWAFGYIKFPYVEENYSFWIGFMACAGVLVLFWFLSKIWKNIPAAKIYQIEKGKSKLSFTKVGVFLSAIFIAAIILGAFFFIQNQHFKQQIASLEYKTSQQSRDLEIVKEHQKMSLLFGLLEKIDSSRKDGVAANLSDDLINTITTLSYSFKNHREFDRDSKEGKSLSFERGQLLLALVATKMDSISWRKIKENVSFWGADLSHANLEGKDLSGIDLRKANLQQANLQGINLNNSNLNGANLARCNLDNSKLFQAIFHNSNLNWAKINNAEMSFSKLDSSNLSSATIIKSNLSHSTMYKTNFNYALLNQSDLTGCLIEEASLVRTNFSNAILTNISIRFSNLNDAIMNGAMVNLNWFEQLNLDSTMYVKDIHKGYKIVKSNDNKSDTPIYRLSINSTF